MRTRNVNRGAGGFAVTEEKYAQVRKAILAALPRGRAGIPFQELVERVKPKLSSKLFPKRGSASWYTKVVQLDLEARGEVERVPGSRPQRLRRRTG